LTKEKSSGESWAVPDRSREIEVPHVILARWAIEKQAAESFF
jgi:hypothetical protein